MGAGVYRRLEFQEYCPLNLYNMEPRENKNNAANGTISDAHVKRHPH
jgi:hypothetical protein